MKQMYAIIFLTMICYVQSHILSRVTNRNKEDQLSKCMTNISSALTMLCPIYGFQYEDVYSDEVSDILNLHKVMECCLKPCSLPELLNACSNPAI